MVVRTADVTAAMDDWFDPRTAESWDAVGLVCGDPSEPVERVLLAVDAVPATVREAVDGAAALLITHHPLLLTGVHGVPADDPKGALVHAMIRSGVAHFVAHTNADRAAPGVSDALAECFGVRELRPLEPLREAPSDASPTTGPAPGTGRIGVLDNPMPLREFTALAAAALPATIWGVRAAGDPDRPVHIVAVCGGSGGSLADRALSEGADVLLTADLKHHGAVEAVTERAAAGLALVDAAHWATEAPWLDALAARLAVEFGTNLEVHVSRQVTDPWTLHAPSSAAKGRP